MLQKRSVQEYRVPGDQRSVVQCKTVIQEGLAGLVPPLQLIQPEPHSVATTREEKKSSTHGSLL
eukprot:4711879-Amphidinium_carterae.1